MAAYLSIDRPGQFTPIYRGGGVIDFTREEVSGDLVFEQPRIEGLRFIVDVTGVYMKGTADVGLKLPTGDKWLLLEPRDFSQIRFDISSFLQGDPTQEFRFLARHAGRPRRLGPDNIGGAIGVEEHYRMIVDLSRLKTSLRRREERELSSASRDDLHRLLDQLGPVTTALVKDVWIGAEGRVVRDATTITARVGPKNRTASLRRVFDYLEYGSNFYVNPPPPGAFST
ncbi:MAG TPA: hypothetical protein VF660_10075 [Actinomycetota bacterium]